MKWLMVMLLTTKLWAVALTEEDKKLHIVTTMVISCVITDYTDSMWYGLLAGITVGIAKEMYDEYTYRGADIDDMKANLVGSALGIQVRIIEW